jgi:acetyl esterase
MTARRRLLRLEEPMAVEITLEPDPSIRALIELFDVPAEVASIDELRALFSRYLRDMSDRTEQTLLATEDATVPGPTRPIPIRTYEPTGSADGVLDVVVFFHGGGWVAGDLDTADAGARALAVGLGARVVSVDYALAPEAVFPEPLDECVLVTNDVAARETTRRLLVAGESAGGNLAAAVALRVDPGVLSGQVLINPVLDEACVSASHERFGTDYGLTTEAVKRFLALYAAGTDPANPFVSPLNAPSLRGLPPAVITTAGFDPVRDDGVRYAQRLLEDDVPVVYLPMPTFLHGWWSVLAASEVARRELGRIVAAARALLIAPTSATA